jgi:hypothetical protein
LVESREWGIGCAFTTALGIWLGYVIKELFRMVTLIGSLRHICGTLRRLKGERAHLGKLVFQQARVHQLEDGRTKRCITSTNFGAS